MKQVYVKVLFVLMVVLFFVSGAAVAQVGGSHVVTTRKASATTVKKTTNPYMLKEKNGYAPVTKGWYNTIRCQYGLLVSLGLHYQGGYRFNKVFELGGGTGYECVFHSFRRDYLGRNFSYHSVPLYANTRFFIKGNRRVNPFFGISTGINFTFYKIAGDYVSDDYDYYNNYSNFTCYNNGYDIICIANERIASFGDSTIIGHTFAVGFLAQFEFGCNFRVTPKNSVGVSLGVKNVYYHNGNYYYYNRGAHYDYNRGTIELTPFVSLGCTF